MESTKKSTCVILVCAIRPNAIIYKSLFGNVRSKRRHQLHSSPLSLDHKQLLVGRLYAVHSMQIEGEWCWTHAYLIQEDDNLVVAANKVNQ